MIKILIADDHAIVRQGLRRIPAETSDMVVGGEAQNGEEVLNKVRSGDWDVVVLDITMPALGGIEAAARIRRVAPNSKIVFLSQHDSEKIAQAALATGALGYVTKVAVSTDLIAAVKAVLEGKKFVSKFSGSDSRERTFWIIFS